MKKMLLVTVGALLFEHSAAAQTREAREIAIAENAVLTSQVIGVTPKARDLCTKCPLACIGPDAWELGLSSIGARHTAASRRALVALLRYRRDAALAEDYDCYILQEGKALKKYLRAVRPNTLVAQCQREIERLQKQNPELGEVPQQYICALAADITSDARKYLSLIAKGGQCDPEDF